MSDSSPSPSPSPSAAAAAPARDVAVSIENVTKAYLPPPPMRLRRFFSRFGGLHVEDGFAADALAGQVEDDEDELDEDVPLDDDALPQRDELVGRRVIDDVTLEAHAGSLIALVGPEGAGKTVLLKLIAGTVAPSSGRVVVRGTVVPALNVMALVLPARGHTVRAALPQLGAMAGIAPHVVRSRLGDIVELMDSPALLKSSTSLMESRRKRELVLAMALALEPDVLLVDVAIARDAFGDRCVQRIDELRAGGTLVIAEMRDTRKTRLEPDRVVLMDHGQILPE
jgi:ABC-type polysaccharide/polyol phosphate transport system ATPase subunit